MRQKFFCIFFTLCLIAGLMPTGIFANTGSEQLDVVYVDYDSGNDSYDGTTEEYPLQSFEAAMEKVAEGGTIMLGKGGLYINDTGSNSAPFIIEKPVTFKGKAVANTYGVPNINLRSGAIVLNGDVTFDTVSIGATNSSFKGIFANGYNLTIKNCKSPNVGNMDIFCGGLYLDGSFTGKPSTNKECTVTVQKCDELCVGNIFAGAYGAACDRDDVETRINIKGELGKNSFSSNIASEVYAMGFDGANGKVNKANVLITLEGTNVAVVDGGGGGDFDALVNVKTPVDALDVKNATLKLQGGKVKISKLGEKVAVLFENDSVLDLSGLETKEYSIFALDSGNGKGKIILDKEGCLNVTQQIGDTSSVDLELVGGAKASYNHVYVKTPGGTPEDVIFTFVKDSLPDNKAVLKKNSESAGGYIWKLDTEDRFDNSAVVSLKDEKAVIRYDGTAKEPELKVVYQNNELEKGVGYHVVFENNINAGTATAKVYEGASGYSGEPAVFNFNIEKEILQLSSAVLKEKVYDGKAEAEVESIEFNLAFKPINDELALETDLMTSAVFDKPDAGKDRTAVVTVELKDTPKAGNYTFTYTNEKINNTITLENQEIRKAELDGEVTAVVDVINKKANKYIFDLKSLIKLPAGMELGNTTFEVKEDSISLGGYADKSGITVENGSIVLVTKAVDSDKEEEIGSFIVNMESSNFNTKDVKVIVKSRKNDAANPLGSSGGSGSKNTVKPEDKSAVNQQPAEETKNEGSKKTATVAFADVKTNDWYLDAVSFVSEKGLMKGTDPSSFSPNGKAERGMIVEVLYRMAGSPVVDKESSIIGYSDIKGRDYYKDAVCWAKSKGIARGYSDDVFAPKEAVTREDFAVMLWRYAGKPLKGNSIEGFKDTVNISLYSKKALEWAYGQGILNGNTDGTLNPKGYATRAEMAAMLQRFMTQ